MNPDMAYPFTDRMTLNERIRNILYTTWTRLYYRYWHLPRAQRIANEWAPGTSVYDIDKNFSLVILGNNHVFGYPKPLLPHVIEVHSLQITEKPDPLPEVKIQRIRAREIVGKRRKKRKRNADCGKRQLRQLRRTKIRFCSHSVENVTRLKLIII